MWPFDKLRRMFGGKPAREAGGDALEDRLAEFVNQDHGSGAAQSPQEKSTSREKIEAAKRIVDHIAGTFHAYVSDKVLRRFSKDFRLDVPTRAQIRDLDAKFGDTKTGNEYRYVRVTFQNRFVIALRVQAMILSRDVQLKVAYVDHGPSGAHHVDEVDLAGYPSLQDVRWNEVYERVFATFLDWHRTVVAKSG